MYWAFGVSVASAVFCVLAGEQCVQNSFEINTRLPEEHTIGVFNTSQHKSCARSCLSINACKSMAFHRATNSCILYDVDSSSGNIEFENVTGFVYSDIGTWSPELAGPCRRHKCAENQACYPTGQSIVCRDIDCGTLTPIEFGIVNVTSTGFGSTLDVTCQIGFMLEGSSSIRCYADRQWSAAPLCKPNFVACIDVIDEWRGYAVGFSTNLTLADAVCPPSFGINSSTVVRCDLNGTYWTIGECIGVTEERCYDSICFNYYESFHPLAVIEVDSVMGFYLTDVEACVNFCNITTTPRYVSISYHTPYQTCQCINCTMDEYINAEYPYVGDVNYEFYELL